MSRPPTSTRPREWQAAVLPGRAGPCGAEARRTSAGGHASRISRRMERVTEIEPALPAWEVCGAVSLPPADPVTCRDLGALFLSDRDYPRVLRPSGTQRARLLMHILTMGSVADAVTAVPGKRQLVGEGWSLRADRVEMLKGNAWRALIGVRRGLKLLVTWSDQDKELDVEAWAGEPEETDGVAVIDTGGGDIRLARVPLCSCGVRGCGNAGIQLAKWLPGNKLPALVELLRELPWTETIPALSNVLKGSDLGLIEGPGTDIPARVRISTFQGRVRSSH